MLFSSGGFTAREWVQYLYAEIKEISDEKEKITQSLKEKSKKFWDKQKNIKPKKG